MLRKVALIITYTRFVKTTVASGCADTHALVASAEASLPFVLVNAESHSAQGLPHQRTPTGGMERLSTDMSGSRVCFDAHTTLQRRTRGFREVEHLDQGDAQESSPPKSLLP